MFLVLEIISPEPMPFGGGRHVFGREGGTIGRGPRNAWVLSHAKVSGVHARISFHQSAFYIEDTSRNGVFVNSWQNRLVRDQPYPLKAGDRILIDPYEIRVSIESDEQSVPVHGEGSSSPPGLGSSGQPSSPFGVDDPFAPGPIAPEPLEAATPVDPLSPAELDPLALLGLGSKAPPPRKAPMARDVDSGSLVDEHFQPPPVTPPPGAAPAAVPPAPSIPASDDPLAPEADAAPAEVVQCTVFAPPAVVAGASAMIQVFAHLAADAERVQALAREFDDDSRSRGSRELEQEVQRGTRLVFSLSIPGIGIDAPVQTLTWRGRPGAVQFGASVPLAMAGRDVVGTVYVSQDRVPFGHVKFVLRCRAAAEQPPASSDGPRQQWKRYEFAFISYASPDRLEVLKRVQMLARCRIDFFQDVLSLDPGERWQRALYKMIDRSDVVFLFWSKAARDSEWVRKEILYALERKAGNDLAPPEIVPIIIEGPPPVLPPPDLASLHFNDPFLYFIAGS